MHGASGGDDDVAAEMMEPREIPEGGAVDSRNRFEGTRDGLAKGVGGPEGGGEEVVDVVRGVLPDHGDLLPDDVSLQLDLVLGEGGVPYHVGEGLDEGGHEFGLALRFVNGVIFGSASVRLPAAGLDGKREFFRGARCGALERHVLGKVREPRGNAARFIPRAGRDVDGQRGALGIRQARMGKPRTAGEIVGGVGGGHGRRVARE